MTASDAERPPAEVENLADDCYMQAPRRWSVTSTPRGL